MKYIGITECGRVLVEMSADEFNRLGVLPMSIELLAEQMRAYRTVNKMSQGTFAKRCGISRNYLVMIENNDDTNVSLGIITRIMEALAQ